MQGGLIHERNVRLSVCQTREMWQNEINFCSRHFYIISKGDASSFATGRMVGGDVPFYLKCCAIVTHPLSRTCVPKCEKVNQLATSSLQMPVRDIIIIIIIKCIFIAQNRVMQLMRSSYILHPTLRPPWIRFCTDVLSYEWSAVAVEKLIVLCSFCTISKLGEILHSQITIHENLTKLTSWRSNVKCVAFEFILQERYTRDSCI